MFGKPSVEEAFVLVNKVNGPDLSRSNVGGAGGPPLHSPKDQNLDWTEIVHDKRIPITYGKNYLNS